MFASFRIQGSAKDDSVPHSKALHRNERFHAEHHVAPFVTLTWITECVLLDESIPRPGQLQEIVRIDSHYVVFCVKVALPHLYYLRLVLIQVQVAKMLFTDRASRDTLCVFYLIHNRF